MKNDAKIIIGFVLMVSLIAAAIVFTSKPEDLSCKGIRCTNTETLAKLSAHPRIFFTQTEFNSLKSTTDPQFVKIKQIVDSASGDNTTFKALGYVKVNGVNVLSNVSKPKDWGTEAAMSAFIYKVSGNKVYLDKAIKMLRNSVDGYVYDLDNGMVPDYYSKSRINWLAAYDWVYNDMSSDDRAYLESKFIVYLEKVRAASSSTNYLICKGWSGTGGYCEESERWYAGLAFYGNGIDTTYESKIMNEGLDLNRQLLLERVSSAGTDGGMISAATNYALAAYPWFDINTFYSWQSATGEDLSQTERYLSLFPNFVYWNWIGDSTPLEFGYGDTYHYDNKLSTSYLYGHLMNIANIYAKSEPNRAANAAYLASKLTPSWTNDYFFYPFKVKNTVSPKSLVFDNAKYFENFGQVYMKNSGTYALFDVGYKLSGQHKHYDAGNFVIYKDGFLALDSGSRGAESTYHLQHYYAQTVAHNTILIQMPNEKFATHWGPLLAGQYSYGGQNKKTGSKLLAFNTTSKYTYAIADLTPTYSSDKTSKVIRTFVFVYPNTFVIFDKVNSKQPSYTKQWLLHTENEPIITGTQFSITQGAGSMKGYSLYPYDAQITKVGGAGSEYWANDRNWLMEDSVYQKYKLNGFMGNYRIEITPKTAQNDDMFVVALTTGTETFVPQLFEDANTFTVKTANANVVFDKNQNSVVVI